MKLRKAKRRSYARLKYNHRWHWGKFDNVPFQAMATVYNAYRENSGSLGDVFFPPVSAITQLEEESWEDWVKQLPDEDDLHVSDLSGPGWIPLPKTWDGGR